MPCVFLRLAGCNAWDGRPETRAASACPYCDTDFLSGEALDLATIIARLDALTLAQQRMPTLSGPPPGVELEAKPTASEQTGCVLTGGEPLLQADADLLAALGARFPWVDIETNGTRPCPARPSNVFISCSPKRIRDAPIVVTPDWWKVLIPDQQAFLPQALASGKPVFVQPTCPDGGPTGAAYAANLKRCLDLCFAHGCRLSVQLHKYLGLP
jgi:organic radical activating enzyme